MAEPAGSRVPADDPGYRPTYNDWEMRLRLSRHFLSNPWHGWMNFGQSLGQYLPTMPTQSPPPPHRPPQQRELYPWWGPRNTQPMQGTPLTLSDLMRWRR